MSRPSATVCPTRNHVLARALEIVGEVLELGPAQRSQAIGRLVGSDPALKTEVDSLLEHAPAVDPSPSRGLAGPTRIGRYDVLEELGRGGMGVVYLGRDAADPKAEPVAIKVLKRGLDTESVLARFDRERRVIAEFDHPGLARFLDAGETDDGRPYFVMERVEGIPITRYCDARDLSLHERIARFRAVCDIVAYVHDCHVVHRDLKPSNILVTRHGTPKLLDFGVAKILGSDDRPGSPTTVATVAMTPQYASPEQIEGRPVTERTDVYQLGLVLYELLVGRRPYDVPAEATELALREIVRKPVETPSSAIGRPGAASEHSAARVSWQRGTTSSSLRRALRGDLDAIVLRALEKQPHRRYGSVRELAQDLDRCLAGEPIAALAYHAMRRLRRYGLAAGLTVAASLGTVGAVTLTTSARAAERAREYADLATIRRTAFDAAQEERLRELGVLVPALDSMNERLALADDPEMMAAWADAMRELSLLLGATRTPSGGDFEKAIGIRRTVLEIQRGLMISSPGLEAAQPALAHAWRIVSGPDAAAERDAIQAAIEDAARAATDAPAALADLRQEARTLSTLEGDALQRALTTIRPRLGRLTPLVLVDDHRALGDMLTRQGNHAEARRHYDAARDAIDGLGDDVALAQVLVDLGKTARQVGADEAARRFYLESLELRRRLREEGMDTSDATVATVLTRLGKLEADLGNHPGALELLESAYGTRRSGPIARQAFAAYTLAHELLRNGQPEEAAHYAREFIAWANEDAKDNVTYQVMSVELGATVDWALKDAASAIKESDRAIALLDTLLATETPTTARIYQLADLLHLRATIAGETGDERHAVRTARRLLEFVEPLAARSRDDVRLQQRHADALLLLSRWLIDTDALAEGRIVRQWAEDRLSELHARFPQREKLAIGLVEAQVMRFDLDDDDDAAASAADGLDALATIYEGYGDVDRAQAARTRATDLRRRAGAE